MASLNVHIPYSRIARIAPVMARSGESMTQVKTRVGCDYIINGGTYTDTLELDSGLKIDGEYKKRCETFGLGIKADGKTPEWSYAGIYPLHWIGAYSISRAPDGTEHGVHITDRRQRTGMGYDATGIVLAATTNYMTTADFARKYLAGCTAWINLDGGGSTQWIIPSASYLAKRKVMWYVCVWLIKNDKTNGKEDDSVSMITNLPLNGTITMTAEFGRVNTKLWGKDGHKGIDLVSADRTIYSPCNGTVRKVLYDPKGWGHYVTIGSVDNKYVHVLCHMAADSIKVKVGDKVTRTTVIGTMGSTGNSTGVHLHYQINTLDNTAVDPSFWTHLPNKPGVYKASDYAVDKDGKLLTAPTPPEPTNTPPNAQTNTPAALDNTPDAWAKDAVDRAVKAGVLQGDDKGDLKLHSPVTRQELAVMLARAGVI